MNKRLNLEKRHWLAEHARAGASLRVMAAAWEAALVQLQQRLSPEQIAAAAAPALAISAATIRRRLAADRRAGGRLFRHLRPRGQRRIPRQQRDACRGRHNIPARRSWRLRPPAAQFRREAGHWEIDTIAGRGENRRAGALILVDRATRRNLLYPLPRFNARAVAQAAATVLRGEIVRSITADNGAEFAQHQRITEATGAPVFFADPGRPQQRGSCENAIARVRDLTRGWTFGNRSPRRLQAVAERLNNRPMKLHGWLTPNQAALRL